MPVIMGILVGTKALVRMAHGIISPVSGLVDPFRTSFLWRNSLYSCSVSKDSPLEFIKVDSRLFTSLCYFLMVLSELNDFKGEHISVKY